MMKRNFLRCGMAGWCMEILWTGLHSFRVRDPKLTGHSSLWMFPIYGCAAFLEPLMRRLISTPFWKRGLIYMLWKKIISWHIPVSILVTVFVFSGIMHLVNPELYVSPVIQLLSGGLMLGAVFMATDYVTSPMSKKGMLIYGVCIGLLTVIIRLFGAYPEGMSFAILIMNAFTPLINTYCKPKRFGEVAKKK